MRLTETLRMIWTNLLQNKSKVLLTSLGIIIGTLTIILVIAIGKGGEEEVARQYSSMSAETIYVNVIYSDRLDFASIPRISTEHLAVILEENPYLEGIYLRTTLFQETRIGQKKKDLTIAAVTQGYSEISSLPIAEGTDFADADFEDGGRVVVLGNNVAQQNFTSPEAAVGESLVINNARYEIIGVLAKKSEGLQGLSPDDSVFLPLQTAQNGDMLDDYAIPQAVGLATSTEVIDQAMTRLKSSLDYLLEDSTMYGIEDTGGRIEAALQSARTMKMLLVSVAAIVFLVGGIGIMNVLFVSVKERTKEIGILKALGTSKKDILLLFLLESVEIGLFGGIVGVLVSFAAMPLMQRTGIAVSPSVEGWVIALFFAVGTAAVFGFYPAYKAAGLKPIDALTYE